MSPKKIASGYINAISVTVHETVHITCNDLWAKDEADIRKALLEKLLKRYCFKIFVEDETVDDEVMKKITQKALSMMSKALNTWRHTANLKKDEDLILI
jgi:predicted flavoprotein YhiN